MRCVPWLIGGNRDQRPGGCGVAQDGYLYDTFDGLAAPYSSAAEREQAPTGFHAPGLYEAVFKRFSEYSNVRVPKGVVPDVLATQCPARI